MLEALDPVFNLSAIRPVMNLSTPTNVSIYFTLFGILGVVSDKVMSAIGHSTAFINSTHPEIVSTQTMFSSSQDEKAQVLTTYIWQTLVSASSSCGNI